VYLCVAYSLSFNFNDASMTLFFWSCQCRWEHQKRLLLSIGVQGKYSKMLVNLSLPQICDNIFKLRPWLLEFNFDHFIYLSFLLKFLFDKSNLDSNLFFLPRGEE